MLEKLARFMAGRYGGDKLNYYLLFTGLFFSLLSSIFNFYPLVLISYAFWVYSIFRTFSRNILARQKEFYSFNKLVHPIESWFKFKKTVFTQRKTYKYFKCPKCKQKLRAPKGRGKIKVVCQKCKHEFEKKV
ncbi:MAG: hypothetical protein R3Y33_09165 [Clostridia bacterium]